MLPKCKLYCVTLTAEDGQEICYAKSETKLRIHMSHTRIRLCKKKLSKLSLLLQSEHDEVSFLRIHQHLTVTPSCVEKSVSTSINHMFEKLLLAHTESKLFSGQKCSNKYKRWVVNLSMSSLSKSKSLYLNLALTLQ